MTIETQVLDTIEPVAPSTETQTPVDDAQKEEVAQPKEEGQEPVKEPSESDRALAAKQRRIDRLTRERYEERGQMNARLADLEAKLIAREQPTDPQPQTQGLTQQDIERRATEIAGAQRFNDRCNELVSRGQKSIGEDFTKAVTVLNEEGALFTSNNKPTSLLESILDSDAPEALIAHLGKNPDLAAELADLSPLRQAKRIGLLEFEIGNPKAREPSRAPKPLQPVKPVASVSDEPDINDTAKWIKWSSRQDAKKRNR